MATSVAPPGYTPPQRFKRSGPEKSVFGRRFCMWIAFFSMAMLVAGPPEGMRAFAAAGFAGCFGYWVFRIFG